MSMFPPTCQKHGRLMVIQDTSSPAESYWRCDLCYAEELTSEVSKGFTVTTTTTTTNAEPPMHPHEARFFQILKECGELHKRKSADYGNGEDPFANVLGSLEWGVEPWIGIMIRVGDKMRRLQSLIKNGKLENESAEDSFRDIGTYTFMALVLFEEYLAKLKPGFETPDNTTWYNPNVTWTAPTTTWAYPASPPFVSGDTVLTKNTTDTFSDNPPPSEDMDFSAPFTPPFVPEVKHAL